MSKEATDLWQRARRALTTAAKLTDEDPDASASRAYYAAYFAVSALFALEGRSFTKHAAVEAAVHRDLVKPGKWSVDLGMAFSWLANLRYTGDYGGETHVSDAEARDAVQKAGRVLDVVCQTAPEMFPDESR